MPEDKNKVSISTSDSSWVGQVRSFNLNQYCEEKNGKITIGSNWAEPTHKWLGAPHQQDTGQRLLYSRCGSKGRKLFDWL